jgi:hypothetical protein
MTGHEVAKAVKKHKGDVCVVAEMKYDSPYIRVVKSDLITHLESIGDDDAGCTLRVSNGVGYLDVF